MKKLAIAGASLALAAMPMAGVFAATTGTVIDNITATVENGCTISTGSGTRSVSVSLAAGESKVANSTAFTLTCNESSWTVAAKGTGQTAGHETELYKSGAATQFSAGTGASGASSNWGYKVTAEGGTAVSNTYAAITSADVTVVNGSATTGTITPSYQVFAAADQEAGAYTGQVTYTIAIND